MKVSPKLILFLNDAAGFSAALSSSLQPPPGSNLHTKEESFHLSLQSYGVKDRNASGKIVHFLKSDHLYEVSIMLVENYEPPLLACALNEVLTSLIRDNASNIPTIVLPFMVPESKLKFDRKDSSAVIDGLVYGFGLGPRTALVDFLCSKLQKPPPSLQINHESLACMLQLLRVLPLPSLVLVGLTDRQKSKKTLDEELQQLVVSASVQYINPPCQVEVMYDIGEILASFSSQCFLRDKIVWSPLKSTVDTKEPWHALYG